MSTDLLAEDRTRQPVPGAATDPVGAALYRSGRHVEALRSLDDARRVLADDVGVEPGPELRALERAILDHDASVGTPDPAATAPIGGVGASRSALFGRGAEVAAMDAALRRLAAGGGAVIVTGEAGIGKTSLLRHLRDEAASLGIAVGWGRCPESATAAPYRSWSTAIRQIIDTGGSDRLAAALPRVDDDAPTDDLAANATGHPTRRGRGAGRPDDTGHRDDR